MAAVLFLGPVPTPVFARQPEHAGAVVIPLAQRLRLGEPTGPIARWQRDAEGRLTCHWLPVHEAGRRPL